MATGVPPYVTMLWKFQCLQAQQVEVIDVVKKAKREIVNDLVQELERRALANNPVTYHGLSESISRSLKKVGVDEMVSKLKRIIERPELLTETQVTARRENVETSGTAIWSGIIPPDFTIEDVSPRNAWQLWHFGDVPRKLPPYKCLRGCQMPNRTVAKAFSKLKILMMKFKKVAQKLKLAYTVRSLEDCNSVFSQVSQMMKIRDRTLHQRKKRRAIKLENVLHLLDGRRKEVYEALLKQNLKAMYSLVKFQTFLEILKDKPIFSGFRMNLRIDLTSLTHRIVSKALELKLHTLILQALRKVFNRV